MDLREVGCDDRDWINLAQDRDRWRAYNAHLSESVATRRTIRRDCIEEARIPGGFVVITIKKWTQEMHDIDRGGRQTNARTHFDIGCHARIPTRNTILRWVASFRITGSTLKKKSPGRNSIALRLSEATIPRFNTLDYCIWGWMKDIVYQIRVQTGEELIQRILDAAATIRNKYVKLRNATRAVHTRANLCLQMQGGNF
ncbi:hypothetical protein ANN_10561 [Periplaneta americana]|uniref:Uncharacterized protein n=1 Tax=Periplaneta americana TaxID=6978 RepID=A0ABQ8TPC3_PERAM|nr:hypothetical protein ANN_10561 [Periplaneta americana]